MCERHVKLCDPSLTRAVPDEMSVVYKALYKSAGFTLLLHCCTSGSSTCMKLMYHCRNITGGPTLRQQRDSGCRFYPETYAMYVTKFPVITNLPPANRSSRAISRGIHGNATVPQEISIHDYSTRDIIGAILICMASR